MITEIITIVRKWHETRLAVQQLAQLSDTQLADIGLRRFTLDDVIGKGLRG